MSSRLEFKCSILFRFFWNWENAKAFSNEELNVTAWAARIPRNNFRLFAFVFRVGCDVGGEVGGLLGCELGRPEGSPDGCVVGCEDG